MIIAAFDLGKTFGWAYNVEGEIWTAELKPERGLNPSLRIGSSALATDKETRAWAREGLDRRCDPRYARFRDRVSNLTSGADIVIFEDVKFTNGRCQCHLWATWRAALWTTVAPSRLACVPTGTLKKFATGKGGASKEQMADAMCRREPGRFQGTKAASVVKDLLYDELLDDNAVDAYWLWQWANDNIKK